MSDDRLRDESRELWRRWAVGQSIPADRVEPAVDAALRVAGSGASAYAAAAAARLAAGRPHVDDATLLSRELARAQAAEEEVGGLAPTGPVTEEALAALRGIFDARRDALADALQPVSARTAPAAAPAAPGAPAAASAAPAPAERPPPPRRAAPSLRELLSEHSILLISCLGAFLLVVAAVLYELYAIGELSGGLRFAGVLGVDLVFAAAGWACLRSRRMRLVGHTYVAIFALLAPLVFVAAYVFLGLDRRGISVDVALMLTGGALTVLYGGLCLRLGSQAYGYLALAALPVAVMGGVNAAGPGAWHGPVAALLVTVYALAAAGTRRLTGLGERFAGRVPLFVHGAALLAAAVSISTADLLTWASAATLAVTGAGYAVARLAAAIPGAAHLCLAALGLAWGIAAHVLGLGGWTAPAVVPVTAALVVLGRAGTPFDAGARHLVHPSAAAAALLAAGLWANDIDLGHPIAWWLPTALALLGGTYVLHRLLSGWASSLLVAAAAASLAVLAANAALGLGQVEAAVELLVLAAGWAIATEVSAERELRLGLHAGAAVQALAPVLFVSLPAPVAAAALLASTALLALQAWRTRIPAWLLLAATAFTVDWYWLGRAVLPPAPPSTVTLALLYSPLPVVLAAAAMVLRAVLGRAWAWPLYAAGGTVALAVLALSSEDAGLAGRVLLAYAAVTYAAGAIDRLSPVIALAGIWAGVGLLLALEDAGTAPAWNLLALTGLAVVIYAGQLAWRRASGGLGAVHRFLGLGGSGFAALAGFTLGETGRRGAMDAILAALAVLAFAGLLAVDGRWRRRALLDDAALVAASFASYFVARFLGATNPQWYAAAPGLAMVAVGLAMPHDRRLEVDRRVPQIATALGAALLLGTSAVQAFADAGWGYTAWLVAEAIVAVLVGIAARSRTLVVAGAAAVGAGGLRALFVLVQHGLLFVAFGSAALFLLGLAAALAALRDRVRGSMGTAWREWG